MYHVSCYNQANGKNISGCRTKFGGVCEYCKAHIAAGTHGISWRRRYAPGEAPKDIHEAGAAAATIPAPVPETAPPAAAWPSSGNVMSDDVVAKVLEVLAGVSALGKRMSGLEDRMTTIESNVGSKKDIVVKTPEIPDGVDVGRQHPMFERLLKCVAARRPVFLTGPSGSGKTTAAEGVAKALDFEFYYTGAVQDPFTLVGYRDATGTLVRTTFREAYEHGGVFLLDEGDASDANALMTFTAALSGTRMAFPDGLVKKHANFVAILAANTWGNGATADYCGRNRLDGAFRQRFAFLAWDYDTDLEKDICRSITGNVAWALCVQRVRDKVRAKGIKHMVTPHHTVNGAHLIQAGLDERTVADMTCLAGLTDEQKKDVWAQ